MSAKVTAAPFKTADVKNSSCCIPSLGDAPDTLVKFSNGHFHSKNIAFADMRAMAVGMLDKKPAAVAEICWSTGGSGNWETIALFRKEHGKLICKGNYTPGSALPDGGTMVGRLEIKGNKILMYGEDPMHNRKIQKPLVCSSTVFKACTFTP